MNNEDLAGCMSVVGVVREAHYNYTERAIKAVMVTQDGSDFRVEIPYTQFTFREGMDVDVEMKKTADLMKGKRLKIISTARPEPPPDFLQGPKR